MNTTPVPTRSRRFNLWWIFLLPALAAADEGARRPAQTWHVAPAPLGNDAHPGTAGRPFASLNKGAATATAGDTVWIQPGREERPSLPELIFQSGFEAGCEIVPSGASQHDLIGKDPAFSEKNDWVEDLEKRAGIKTFRFDYTGGDISQRFVRIIPEPGRPGNKVLWFWLNDSWKADGNAVKARVQADMYGIRDGFKELYQSVRVFLHEDFRAARTCPHPIHWCTISEFWNNYWWGGNKNGFRVTLGVGKPAAAESDLNFILDAQDPGMKQVWKADNTQVKVPIGKWFTMEYYFKEGDSRHGRFYLAITPEGEPRQVVFDVAGWTHNTKDPSPDGLTDYNPMKLYTSKELVAHVKAQGKTLQIYWDDFKLWRNRRPADLRPLAHPSRERGI